MMAQGASSILMVLVTLVGFVFVKDQIKQTRKSLEHSSNVAVYDISSEFYRYLASHDYLRPYFYSKKQLVDGDVNSDKLLSLCEYLADFFEFLLIESKHLDPNIYESWKDYISFIHSNSPVFQMYMKEYEANYTDELIDNLPRVEMRTPPLYEVYLSLTSQIDQSKFVNDLIKEAHFVDPKMTADLLIRILRGESNSIISHDVAFAIGVFGRQLKETDQQPLAKSLIEKYTATESTVLKHEILEALGELPILTSKNFVESILASVNCHADVLATAEISNQKILSIINAST